MVGNADVFYVLVVDDDTDMLSLLGQMVHLAGHQAGTANNAVTALELARDHNPDVIILDIMMSNIDGWTVYERLRDITSAPVIFLTAWRTAENAERAKSLGERFAAKPIALTELRKMLAEAIEDARKKRERARK